MYIDSLGLSRSNAETRSSTNNRRHAFCTSEQPVTTTKTLFLLELDLNAREATRGIAKLDSSVGTIRLRLAGYECIVEEYVKPTKQQEV